MKNILLLSLCLLLSSACSINQLVLPDRPYVETSKELNLKNFDALRISGASIATVQTGDYKIIVTGDEVDLEDLNASVKNGTFSYHYDTNNKKHFGLKFQISMPKLNDLNLSGASTANISTFNSEVFTATISGASKVNANDNTMKTVKVNLSGASKVAISASDLLTATLSGASDLNAQSAITKAADINASGASKSRLLISQSLTVEASGASSIYYKGNPAVKSKVSGASKLVKE